VKLTYSKYRASKLSKTASIEDHQELASSQSVFANLVEFSSRGGFERKNSIPNACALNDASTAGVLPGPNVHGAAISAQKRHIKHNG
jgi:hypothetical protein